MGADLALDKPRSPVKTSPKAPFVTSKSESAEEKCQNLQQKHSRAGYDVALWQRYHSCPNLIAKVANPILAKTALCGIMRYFHGLPWCFAV